MKDLDFDELDRAVNSIMSGAKGPSSTKEDTAPKDTPVSAPEPSVAPTTPDVTVSMPVPMSTPTRREESTTTTAEPPKLQPAGTIERKAPVPARRGRFMDMVRPDAVQSNDPGAARVSRQGSTIEPATGPLVTDIIPSTATPPVAKKTPSVVTPMLTTTASPPPTTTEWPDPLDMLQDDDSHRSSGDNEPLVSPFLSGTKVEKRPLGAALTQPPKEDVDASPETASVDASEKQENNLQLTPNPVDSIAAPLPEELSSDVMALESDANTIAMPTDEVKSEVIRQVAEQEETPVAQSDSVKSLPTAEPVKETDEQPAEAPIAKPAVSSEPEPVTPKGPISIPQQYREEPSTGDKGNGAIYDTDTYHHQPLAHPKKKKSGWLWVVWILLILAVGAACGAALYMLGVF